MAPIDLDRSRASAVLALPMRILPLIALTFLACTTKPAPAPEAVTARAAPNRGVVEIATPIPVVATASASVTLTSPHPTMPRSAAALAKSSNALGYDLYRKLAPGNAAMSPTSVSVALAMALSGARGATEAELATTTHLDGIDPSARG